MKKANKKLSKKKTAKSAEPSGKKATEKVEFYQRRADLGMIRYATIINGKPASGQTRVMPPQTGGIEKSWTLKLYADNACIFTSDGILVDPVIANAWRKSQFASQS